MQREIAARALSYKARRAPSAGLRGIGRDTSEGIAAQMWCAAALSPCDVAVRAGASRCTSRGHRMRGAAACECMRSRAALASCAARRHGRGPRRDAWPVYC
ncbi:hypothetical protein WI94_17580 [Burkholderia vietnamiensis]|nr:hypothetical protein WI94_17580 [Burkholderia vietnamiensis]KVE89211.1 hypothetical protein WJ00_00135 [Burkholderia vietnamiensis]